MAESRFRRKFWLNKIINNYAKEWTTSNKKYGHFNEYRIFGQKTTVDEIRGGHFWLADFYGSKKRPLFGHRQGNNGRFTMYDSYLCYGKPHFVNKSKTHPGVKLPPIENDAQVDNNTVNRRTVKKHIQSDKTSRSNQQFFNFSFNGQCKM